MILDDAIFTIDDVREVRKVSVHIDDFNQFAREIQMNYLQPLLGDKLYSALQNDLVSGVPDAVRFQSLVNGEQYVNGHNIIFRGLKMYCVYLWLHSYLANADLSITSTGSQLFKDEFAQRNETASALVNSKAFFIESADRQEEPILEYLRFHKTLYPEFSESKEIEGASADNNTFMVVGKTYDPPNNFLH